MTTAVSTPVPGLWQRLAQWLGLPGAADKATSEPGATGVDDEAGRKSVHDVTLEQLGIAHWTSHTLF